MNNRLPLAVPSPFSIHKPDRLLRIAALTLALTILVALTGAAPASAATASFEPPVYYTIGRDAQDIETGDFNNDGIPDLATANILLSTITVLIGAGDGTFSSISTFSPSPVPNTLPHALELDDLDGDGNLDIVVALIFTSKFSVIMGNGDGTFDAPVTYNTAVLPTDLDTVDLDRDGDPDLLVASPGAGGLYSHYNNGDGTFSTSQGGHVSMGEGPNSIVVTDLNGDGLVDWVATDVGPDQVLVRLGEQLGWEDEVGYNVGPDPESVTVGDLDGDGAPDLVVSNTGDGDRTGDGTLTVWYGVGDGTFSSPLTIPIGDDSMAKTAIGDLNGDGLADIAAAGLSGQITVVFGTGGRTFGPATAFGTVAESFSTDAAIVDLDSDGRLDLAVTGSGTSLTVLMNSTDLINPTVTLTTPAEGAFYGLDEVVNASYSCADTGGSGVASCTGTVASGSPIDTSTAGTHVFSVTATDGAGNTITETNTYTVDATVPTITLTTPPDGAFYGLNQVVNASYSCADAGGSGVASCTGTVGNGAPIDTSTTGQHLFVVTAADNVGNPAVEVHIYTVDDTDPTITLATPPDGATYILNESVAASYSCADTGGSGIATCQGPVASGSPIDTSTVGNHTFTVTAVDNVGNQAVTTHNYEVVQSADLSIVKTCPEVMVPGEAFTCTLAVSNEGGTATDVEVSDVLPEGVTLVGTPAGGGFTCEVINPVTFGCDRDTLPAGGDPAVITYTAVAAVDLGPGVTLENSAFVESATFDDDTTNNSDTFTGTTPVCTVGPFDSDRAVGGGDGDDVLCGPISGNEGVSFNGRGGNDIIFSGPGSDIIRGGAGNDTIIGGNGDDSLIGGLGDDRLYGMSGSDSLDGGAGNDSLYGGDGADSLDGGAGTDLGEGGAGSDRCSRTETGVC